MTVTKRISFSLWKTLLAAGCAFVLMPLAQAQTPENGSFNLAPLKEYFQFEAMLKKHMGTIFHRGTVDVYIHRRCAANLDVELNIDVAKKWVAGYKILAKSLNVPFQSLSLEINAIRGLTWR